MKDITNEMKKRSEEILAEELIRPDWYETNNEHVVCSGINQIFDAYHDYVMSKQFN